MSFWDQIKPAKEETWQSWVFRFILWNRQRDAMARPIQLPSYSVNNLPRPNLSGMMIFVVDETGGPTPAYSVTLATSGAWHRVSDGAIVS